MPDDYPRMLYKPGKGKGTEAWGHRLDKVTVESFEEEKTAVRNGWHVDPQQAIKGAIRRQKLISLWQFYLHHWQWIWGTVFAFVIAALFSK